MAERQDGDGRTDGAASGASGDASVVTLDAELPDDDEIESLIEPAAAPGEASQPGVPMPAPRDSGADISEEEAPESEARDGEQRMVMAIASGKGGVGKSLLAAGVGIYLAQLGKRVVLVDANLGSASLHCFLGMDEPRHSLGAFLSKEVKRIEEVVAKTPFRGLGLIGGHDNPIGATNPRPAQKNRLLGQLRSLAVDYVIIDLASGSNFNTLDLFLSADMHVVMAAPEPTAIESAFRLVKSAFVRRIRTLKGMEQLLADLQPAAYCGIPTPNQIYEVARERDPVVGEAVHRAMAEFKPRLVLNMIRTRDDLELGPALAAVGRRHLALPVDYLGYIESEDVAWITVRRRRPLLVEYPEAKVAKDIERVTRRILSLETKERPECIGVPPALARQNHYEILGLHPGATDEEVRRAHRRVRRIYSPESMAIFGIAPPPEVNKMLSRVEEAYTILGDPEKRHLYDQRVFPGGTPPLEHPLEPMAVDAQREAAPAAGPPAATPAAAVGAPAHGGDGLPLERTPMPVIEDDTVFSGALLRAVREARGWDLHDVAERTKITMTYLRAIEEENFAATPAPVYLRGFLKTIAKELRLPAERVALSYMERYQRTIELGPSHD